MKKDFIVWEKTWETGIKTIDDQHKHFVGIINKTYALNQDKKSKKKLGLIMADLMEYAKIHFLTEENYFEDTDYPEAEEHKKKHQELLAKATGFVNKFEKKEDVSKILDDFLNFLKDWLYNHLIEVDHKYIKWLTEHGIK